MIHDLFHATVILDTSVIRATEISSGPFQVLIGLVAAGLVRVKIPELVAEEIRTQWREKLRATVSDGSKALRHISNEKLMPFKAVFDSKSLYATLNQLDIEVLSKEYIDQYLESTGFEVLDLTFNQSKKAWEGYFSGNLPSNKVKYRSDIPDAHILAAVEEYSSAAPGVIFVAMDKGLRDAAQKINSITCFEKLDDLIKSDVISPLVLKWQSDEKWKEVQPKLSFDFLIDQVRDHVQENGGDLIAWEMVYDDSIPEDNKSAVITLAGDPYDVEVSEPEDWGGGVLGYKIAYRSECLLEFSVFRSDAFDLPDWVSVTLGDPENDHYYDAQGYAEMYVEADVTLKIDLSTTNPIMEDVVDEISFDLSSVKISVEEK